MDADKSERACFVHILKGNHPMNIWRSPEPANLEEKECRQQKDRDVNSLCSYFIRHSSPLGWMCCSNGE